MLFFFAFSCKSVFELIIQMTDVARAGLGGKALALCLAPENKTKQKKSIDTTTTTSHIF